MELWREINCTYCMYCICLSRKRGNKKREREKLNWTENGVLCAYLEDSGGAV